MHTWRPGVDRVAPLAAVLPEHTVCHLHARWSVLMLPEILGDQLNLMEKENLKVRREARSQCDTAAKLQEKECPPGHRRSSGQPVSGTQNLHPEQPAPLIIHVRSAHISSASCGLWRKPLGLSGLPWFQMTGENTRHCNLWAYRPVALMERLVSIALPASPFPPKKYWVMVRMQGCLSKHFQSAVFALSFKKMI